jgi:hypothetical protein
MLLEPLLAADETRLSAVPAIATVEPSALSEDARSVSLSAGVPSAAAETSVIAPVWML